MFENISIKYLSAIITIIFTVLGIGMISLFHFSYGIKIEITTHLLFIFSVCLIYIITSIILNRFIYRRLNIIYKIINKSQKINTSRNKEFSISSFDKVQSDVVQWASDNEKKIQSLQSLAEYRKDFVGNVSHELKTPIFSLQGYLHTLLEGGIYDETINLRYIERAANNADRLQRIVEDLESIGQFESNQMHLEIKNFDIINLISDVLVDQKRLSEKSKIEIVLNEENRNPVFVNADRSAIRQVLNNLIVNSIKYGNINGETAIDIYSLGELIVIEISDNGIGIKEKHVKHVFDRFYRVDKSRSREKGGSGLGLSIVKHIIESHNQSISVRSDVDQGTTFTFTLEKGVCQPGKEKRIKPLPPI